jgi:5-methylcytosine-specific restriction endonuclease McrA
MPRAPKRCSPSCKNKVVSKGKCIEHQPERIPWVKAPGSERPDRKKALKDRQKRRILYRDNNFFNGCRLRFDGCTRIATQVDHIIPAWYAGEEASDDDLQGVCESCHNKKSSFEGVQAKKIKRQNGLY